jgi:isoleucyl-tRNA synthetase
MGKKPTSSRTKAPTLYTVDRWVLAEEEQVKNQALKDYEDFHFASVSGALTNFLVELSSFYLDFSKDILYCDKPDSPRRKAVQYVLYKITMDLCLLYNPILSFTMDEVYSFIPGHTKLSPQLEDMPKESHVYGEKEAKEFAAFNTLRSSILKALEDKRSAGVIGSSQEAEAEIRYNDQELVTLLLSLEKDEQARLFGLSSITLSLGEPSITIKKAEGKMCERCRNFRDDVVTDEEGTLCVRCREALKK